MSEKQNRLTYKNSGYQAIGAMKAYAAYLKSEAKQKLAYRITWPMSLAPGKQLLTDIIKHSLQF